VRESDHVAATRAVYDHSVDQFVDVIGTEVSSRFEAPLDRAVLAAFAEMVSAAGPGPILDVGCGPGRVTSYLAVRGLDVRGIDISLRMIEAARSAHPHLRFDQGSLGRLPVPDGSLGGAVYWFSIIATPALELPAAWHELGRALSDGGQVLVAFQSGDGEPVVRPDAYGSAETLTLHRHGVDEVTATLRAAGFDVRADIRRQPELEHETTPQAFLIATRRR
jgi:SAM-dependent methyltransferase